MQSTSLIFRRIIFASFVFLLSCQSTSIQALASDPVCKKYVQSVCQVCGIKSHTCQIVTQKINECLAKKTCVDSICQSSLQQIKELPLSDVKAMICQEPAQN